MGYSRREERKRREKLNLTKVIIVILILIIAIICIFKLIKKDKNKDNVIIKNDLGREYHTNEVIEDTNKVKTIDDYMSEYGAVLIQKVKPDTYYVSVDGIDCTLYSNGELADGEIPLWDGSSKEIKIEKNTQVININSASELKWVADQVISGERNFSNLTILLNVNIDLGGRINEDGSLDGNKWNSIIGFLEQTEGSDEENLKGFAGIFDGNNHWIRGLIIDSDSKYQGLFGYLNGGTVRNLTIKNGYISGNQGVGAIIGLNNGKIENCKIINTTIKGKSEVGGFVGINMTNSTVDRCVFENNDSTVSGDDNVGGIVGYLNNNSNVENSENRANVFGKNYVGGIVGISFYGTNITNTYCIDASVKGEDYVGGIAGYSQSLIEKCFNSSSISGRKYVGGISGLNYEMGNISLTYNSRKC